jgi:hypothetical protein
MRLEPNSAFAEFCTIPPMAVGPPAKKSARAGLRALTASSVKRQRPAFQSFLVISSMVCWSLLKL